MNLVLDQGLPRCAARALRALGHEVVHVGDVGMSRALDEEILAYALSHGCTVVTLDADFHALLSAFLEAPDADEALEQAAELVPAEDVAILRNAMDRFRPRYAEVAAAGTDLDRFAAGIRGTKRARRLAGLRLGARGLESVRPGTLRGAGESGPLGRRARCLHQCNQPLGRRRLRAGDAIGIPTLR